MKPACERSEALDRRPALGAVVAKAQAAFLGLALGDALGATVEFMTPEEIRSVCGIHRELTGGGWLGLKPGQVTDDTQLSLCLARAVVRARSWDLHGIAEEFAGWLKKGPIDVGATCRRGIRAYMMTGRLEVPADPWGAGNGAAMRMLPVALATLGAPLLLERCALEQARLTHRHPLSDAACVTLGRMMHAALLGGRLPELRRPVDELVRRHSEFGFARYSGEASAYVVETLRTVFHHLFATESFEECLIGVVNRGGDADTAGAIAGAICGALYGPSSLPRRWLRRLDSAVAQEAAEKAETLVLLSPFARGQEGSPLCSAACC